jgi:hypothetical protein
VEEQIQRHHPEWREKDGACPVCIQHALLQTLLERGDAALHESIQTVWPLDAEAAFGALPTPLRMHGDPRFTGRGVTMAMIDAAFYPHPDLIQPRNRILAWADASRAPVRCRYFNSSQTPKWPGWGDLHPAQWHGMMTSSSAAGNGWMGHGLYRGLASEANLVSVRMTYARSLLPRHALFRERPPSARERERSMPVLPLLSPWMNVIQRMAIPSRRKSRSPAFPFCSTIATRKKSR